MILVGFESVYPDRIRRLFKYGSGTDQKHPDQEPQPFLDVCVKLRVKMNKASQLFRAYNF